MFNEIFEELFDELNIEIELDAKTLKLNAATKESDFSESVELNAFTQLLNKHSNEFLQTIIKDVDVSILVNIENEDDEFFLNEVTLDTKVRLGNVDLLYSFLQTYEVDLDNTQLNYLIDFLETHSYQRTERVTIEYQLKIESIQQLNEELYAIKSALEYLGSLTDSYKFIKTFKHF